MMTDKQNQAIDRLIYECYYKPSTARVYIRDSGKCVYCGLDLVEGKPNYAAGAIDHLLPQSKYPALGDNEENLVLCCLSCNSMKSALDVLQAGEDPQEAVTNRKAELVGRVRQVLDRKNVENDRMRAKVLTIVREGNG